MREGVLVGALFGGLALVAATARDARACGGCFHPPSSQVATVVTDHRMIFSVSPMQTTLYDQIRYSGSPSDFAWVLPIHGQVGVGVSSDLLFSVLDQQTQTTILAPPYPCQACNCRTAGPTLAINGPSGGGAAIDAAAGVTVISQQVVGPYATVQLHPNSTNDTAALTDWLQANSYSIPANVDSVIAAYVQEGFDFLAIKLVPGQGVQAMRPISVTTTGAGLSLPLRMVAAGTGARVGITLWVVGSGRYEPQNFPSFVIDPTTLYWDWSVGSSDYATVRAQVEQLGGYAIWQIESSLDLMPYTLENQVLQDPTASAYQAVPAADGGVGRTPLEVRSQDLNTLFPLGGTSVRITRMRADLSQAALAADLQLQAGAQAPISNIYQTTLSVNANCQCPCANGSGSSSGGTAAPFGSSSGSGSSGGSIFGNGGAASDAGSGTAAASSPSGGGGCSTSPLERSGAGFFAALAGLLGVASLRLTGRRRRKHAN